MKNSILLFTRVFTYLTRLVCYVRNGIRLAIFDKLVCHHKEQQVVEVVVFLSSIADKKWHKTDTACINYSYCD